LCTQWNSTLRQLKNIVALEFQPLYKLVTGEGHTEVLFSQKEWTQMKELIEIMDTFASAMVLTQVESDATISAVLPSVLLLNHQLQCLLKKTDDKERYLNKMVNNLKDALMKRFSGIFALFPLHILCCLKR
jgi:L-cystine uptake protein TcyP (sodium:dicarboxylate symporter family)